MTRRTRSLVRCERFCVRRPLPSSGARQNTTLAESGGNHDLFVLSSYIPTPVSSRIVGNPVRSGMVPRKTDGARRCRPGEDSVVAGADSYATTVFAGAAPNSSKASNRIHTGDAAPHGPEGGEAGSPF